MTADRRALVVAGAAGVLAAEILGALLMWGPIPVAWVWVGARVYDASGSFVAGAVAWFLGFAGTLWFAATLLARLDRLWLTLRRRVGHQPEQGPLTRVIVVTATFALGAFFLWFYVLGKAFVIPFMPNGGG